MENSVSVIDNHAIEKLNQICDGDTDFLTELFSNYLKTTEEQITQMETAIQNSDIDSLTHIAHTIKGASANLGVTHVFEISKEMEMLGKTDSVEGADALLTKLREEFITAKTEISKDYI